MGRIVSAILLGAGESKRMGVDKLFLPWGRKTVLENCLKTLLQSKVKEVVVVLNDRIKWAVDYVEIPKVNPSTSRTKRRVLPPARTRIKGLRVDPELRLFTLTSKTGVRLSSRRSPGLAERVKVVNNPYYKRGMSTSIRRGLQAIDPRSFGVLIALGDQPFLKTRTINAIIDAFIRKNEGIIVPAFRGEKGHPVIFHRRYLKELLTLKGDVGGRSIIEKHPEEVRLVHVKSRGVTKDIDTWKDYKKAKGDHRTMNNK